ncbi:MAG: GNAT family N-acetyltransferase [Aggregatilineales bacterium]
MIRVRPACMDDLPALTHIVAEAFNVKMYVLFGREPARIRQMLAGIYSGPLSHGYDGLLLAELDRKPVGALAIEPMPWNSQDATRLELMVRTELSTWRQWWNRVGFSVFSHGPEDGDAYLSDVGVLKTARGRGVGMALIRHAEAWAIAHRRQALTLWVASNNRVARRLYERAGLVATKHEFNWLSGVLFRVPRWTYMCKQLTY